jgi:preprotein translocase subunit SecA
MEMFEAEVRQVVTAHANDNAAASDRTVDAQEAMLAELRRFVPIPRNVDTDAIFELSDDALIAQCLKWADDAYTQMNNQIGQDLYRMVRQQELQVKTLFNTDDPFYSKVGEWLVERVGAEAFESWHDYPLRRLPQDLETTVREGMITVSRLFRDRRLILKQIDDHWIQHLTSLDMLREGIGLRAVGQQNPLVAYQKEAFEMYQEMMGSIQSQIVRSLFLVPEAVATRRERSAPTPAAQPQQRQLSFHAGGSQARDTASEPARAAKKPGRNDPCWCGSGKKYKDCHWRSDRRVASQA